MSVTTKKKKSHYPTDLEASNAKSKQPTDLQ